VFKYSSGEYYSEDVEKLKLEDHVVTYLLRSIKLASVVVEENPAASDCREGHAAGAATCGGDPCPAVPYHFVIDTPFWVRLKDNHLGVPGLK
jgi:hypothetical protein